jgi:two-component system sensor histidine kinase/response regulator
MLNKTILLVDDEKETLAFLAKSINRLGYQVMTASSGAEAIGIAQDNPPDLIFLDIVMPDITGDDVADVLSKNPVTADIPIVFLTAIVTKQEEPVIKKTGKRYLLAKPATPEEISAIIQKIL